jgi:hypothetical protein
MGGHVARIGAKRRAYRLLVGKSERNVTIEGSCIGGRILKSIESAVGGRAGNSSLNTDKWPALVNTVMKF